jgi:hypothetical protein
MAVWELSTEYKKNAIEVQLWYKDGVTIKKSKAIAGALSTAKATSGPTLTCATQTAMN